MLQPSEQTACSQSFAFIASILLWFSFLHGFPIRLIALIFAVRIEIFSNPQLLTINPYKWPKFTHRIHWKCNRCLSRSLSLGRVAVIIIIDRRIKVNQMNLTYMDVTLIWWCANYFSVELFWIIFSYIVDVVSWRVCFCVLVFGGLNLLGKYITLKRVWFKIRKL